MITKEKELQETKMIKSKQISKRDYKVQKGARGKYTFRLQGTYRNYKSHCKVSNCNINVPVPGNEQAPRSLAEGSEDIKISSKYLYQNIVFNKTISYKETIKYNINK